MAEPLRPPSAPWASAPPPRRARTGGWDLLLVSLAVYVATAVGRVHQLFPVLLPLKPALLSALLAIGLLLLQQSGQRRLGLLRSPTTTCLLGLLLWSALSVPVALNQGLAFQAWTDFARTVVMCLVLAGGLRDERDVERVMLVYFGATVVYTAVVLSRFQLGADSWRLGRLYNYDANVMATLTASTMPIGVNFAVAEGTISPLSRLQERGVGVLWGAAHNSFIQVGTELGVPGLLLFLGVIASAFRSLRRVARHPPGVSAAARDRARLAQSLMAALVGFVVGAFFLSLAFADMLYTLAALGIAVGKITRSRGAIASPMAAGGWAPGRAP